MLRAEYGDSLWIEYGRADRVNRVLIDGGTGGAIDALRARIEHAKGDKCHIELLIATHIDSDHIGGILKLFKERARRLSIGQVWFNGSRQLKAAGYLGELEGEFLSYHLHCEDEQRPGFWNGAFGGGAVAVPDSGALPEHSLDGGLCLTVLGPTQRRLRKLWKEWNEVIQGLDMTPASIEEAKERLRRDRRYRPGWLGTVDIEKLANAEFEEDRAPANGSSIAVIAEYDGHKCLFTGDAFPSDIADGLDRLSGVPGSRVPLSLVKVPHHGSQSNNSNELYARIASPFFLVSTNGKVYGHPDPEGIARILWNRPRRADASTLFFNYHASENQQVALWADPGVADEHHFSAASPQRSNRPCACACRGSVQHDERVASTISEPTKQPTQRSRARIFGR
jgi:beta-lactamase superfamily II metal-dependent hydrolase